MGSYSGYVGIVGFWLILNECLKITFSPRLFERPSPAPFSPSGKKRRLKEGKSEEKSLHGDRALSPWAHKVFVREKWKFGVLNNCLKRTFLLRLEDVMYAKEE